MKKLFAAILALSLTAGMSITAAAAGGSESGVGAGEGRSIDVTAVYSGESGEAAVYSVDIVWDDMNFVYYAAGSKEWNPDDHTYTDVVTGGWKTTTADVTVTNHSNISVDVTLTYHPIGSYGIGGALSVTGETLDAGVVNQYDDADSLTSTLTISGTPTGIDANGVKVGTITVTIAKTADINAGLDDDWNDNIIGF